MRGGDVQEWYRICGVLLVPRGQVCGDGRLFRLLNVPVRIERVCQREREGHGVLVLGGVHGEQWWALYSVPGGNVQERDRECSMHRLSVGEVSGRNWRKCVRELRR